MGKKANTIANLVAGAATKEQLLSIIAGLEDMSKGVPGGEDKECLYVVKMLKQGYENWFGEQL